MTEPLVDCHAHFLHALCGRSDWEEVNAARFRAGEKIGITCHVASILGTYGFRSPTYFPSPDDVALGNDAMLALHKKQGKRVAMMADWRIPIAGARRRKKSSAAWRPVRSV